MDREFQLNIHTFLIERILTGIIMNFHPNQSATQNRKKIIEVKSCFFSIFYLPIKETKRSKVLLKNWLWYNQNSKYYTFITSKRLEWGGYLERIDNDKEQKNDLKFTFN